MEYISVTTRTDEIKGLIKSRINNYISEKSHIKLPKAENNEIILSEIIGTYCEKRVIYNLIDERYYDYPRSDRINIYNNVIGNEFMPRVKHLRYLIYSDLNEYLKNNKILIIEGFINFRLNEYKEKLKIIVDEAAENHFIKVEYDNFIEMIKTYVNTQKPLVNIIHIDLLDNNFKLITDDGEDVTDIYTSDINNDYRIVTFSKDDILLSALIGIAPRKIIIHNNDNYLNKTFLETLNKIFINRITFV